MAGDIVNEYMQQVESLINNKQAKARITAEVKAHIDDRTEYYEELGYAKIVAEKRAIEDMGAPEDFAVSLGSLHSKKWYKTRFNIISIGLLFLVCYASKILFSSVYHEGGYSIHLISVDFLSLGIFSVLALLLILSKRRKNKLVPLLILSVLTLFILFELYSTILYYLPNAFSLLNDGSYSANIADELLTIMTSIPIFNIFEPMCYAIISIATSGFSGYIDSIFAHSFSYQNPVLIIISFVVSILLIAFIYAWALSIYITIRRQEKMQKLKSSRKLSKYYERFALALLIVLILIMSICTAIAYNNLDETIAEGKAQQKMMIEYILNADKTLTKEKYLQDIKDAGLSYIMTVDGSELKTYQLVQSFNILSFDDSIYDYDYTGEFSTVRLGYRTMYYDTIFEDELWCTLEDFEVLKSLDYGMTIQDFMNESVCFKSTSVNRSISYEGDSISFFFRCVDGDSCFIDFVDGKMTSNELRYFNDIEISNERKEIIDFIINDNRVCYATANLSDDYFGSEQVLDRLSSGGYDMENTFQSEQYSEYESENTEHRLVMHSFADQPKYHLHCFINSIDANNWQFDNELIFEKEEFSDIYIGMTLADFHNYRHIWTGAVAVTSELENQTENDKTIRSSTISLVFAVEDDDLIKQYVLKFVDGELTDMGLNGYIGNIYRDYSY